MLRANAFEVMRHLIEGAFPTDPFPTAGSTAHRLGEAIFIVMKVLEGDSLRTDIAAAERIVFITADVEVFVGGSRDLDTADRFAEIAVAIMNRVIHGASTSRPFYRCKT